MYKVPERDKLISDLTVRNSNLVPLGTAIKRFAGISTATIRAMTHPNRDYIRADTCEGILMCGWDETMVRDYQQLWSVDGIMVTNIKHVTARLKSFQLYENLTPQEEDHYPEEREQQAETILKVLIHQKQHGADEWSVPSTHPGVKSYPFITDAKLRELLLGSDYDRDMVLSFILERNIFNGEDLARLLETTHPTLTQGAL